MIEQQQDNFDWEALKSDEGTNAMQNIARHMNITVPELIVNADKIFPDYGNTIGAINDKFDEILPEMKRETPGGVGKYPLILAETGANTLFSAIQGLGVIGGGVLQELGNTAGYLTTTAMSGDTRTYRSVLAQMHHEAVINQNFDDPLYISPVTKENIKEKERLASQDYFKTLNEDLENALVDEGNAYFIEQKNKRSDLQNKLYGEIEDPITGSKTSPELTDHMRATLSLQLDDVNNNIKAIKNARLRKNNGVLINGINDFVKDFSTSQLELVQQTEESKTSFSSQVSSGIGSLLGLLGTAYITSKITVAGSRDKQAKISAARSISANILKNVNNGDTVLFSNYMKFAENMVKTNAKSIGKNALTMTNDEKVAYLATKFENDIIRRVKFANHTLFSSVMATEGFKSYIAEVGDKEPSLHGAYGSAIVYGVIGGAMERLGFESMFGKYLAKGVLPVIDEKVSKAAGRTFKEIFDNQDYSKFKKLMDTATLLMSKGGIRSLNSTESVKALGRITVAGVTEGVTELGQDILQDLLTAHYSSATFEEWKQQKQKIWDEDSDKWHYDTLASFYVGALLGVGFRGISEMRDSKADSNTLAKTFLDRYIEDKLDTFKVELNTEEQELVGRFDAFVKTDETLATHFGQKPLHILKNYAADDSPIGQLLRIAKMNKGRNSSKTHSWLDEGVDPQQASEFLRYPQSDERSFETIIRAAFPADDFANLPYDFRKPFTDDQKREILRHANQQRAADKNRVKKILNYSSWEGIVGSYEDAPSNAFSTLELLAARIENEIGGVQAEDAAFILDYLVRQNTLDLYKASEDASELLGSLTNVSYNLFRDTAKYIQNIDEDADSELLQATPVKMGVSEYENLIEAYKNKVVQNIKMSSTINHKTESDISAVIANKTSPEASSNARSIIHTILSAAQQGKLVSLKGADGNTYIIEPYTLAMKDDVPIMRNGKEYVFSKSQVQEPTEFNPFNMLSATIIDRLPDMTGYTLTSFQQPKFFQNKAKAGVNVNFPITAQQKALTKEVIPASILKAYTDNPEQFAELLNYLDNKPGVDMNKLFSYRNNKAVTETDATIMDSLLKNEISRREALKKISEGGFKDIDFKLQQTSLQTQKNNDGITNLSDINATIKRIENLTGVRVPIEFKGSNSSIFRQLPNAVAYYDGKRNTVVINRSKINSLEQLKSVLQHEILGHAILRQALTAIEYNNLIEQAKVAFPDMLETLQRDYKEDKIGGELLANILEDMNFEESFLDKVVRFFKNMFGITNRADKVKETIRNAILGFKESRATTIERIAAESSLTANGHYQYTLLQNNLVSHLDINNYQLPDTVAFTPDAIAKYIAQQFGLPTEFQSSIEDLLLEDDYQNTTLEEDFQSLLFKIDPKPNKKEAPISKMLLKDNWVARLLSETLLTLQQRLANVTNLHDSNNVYQAVMRGFVDKETKKTLLAELWSKKDYNNLRQQLQNEGIDTNRIKLSIDILALRLYEMDNKLTTPHGINIKHLNSARKALIAKLQKYSSKYEIKNIMNGNLDSETLITEFINDNPELKVSLEKEILAGNIADFDRSKIQSYLLGGKTISDFLIDKGLQENSMAFKEISQILNAILHPNRDKSKAWRLNSTLNSLLLTSSPMTTIINLADFGMLANINHNPVAVLGHLLKSLNSKDKALLENMMDDGTIQTTDILQNINRFAKKAIGMQLLGGITMKTKEQSILSTLYANKDNEVYDNLILLGMTDEDIQTSKTDKGMQQKILNALSGIYFESSPLGVSQTYAEQGDMAKSLYAMVKWIMPLMNVTYNAATNNIVKYNETGDIKYLNRAIMNMVWFLVTSMMGSIVSGARDEIKGRKVDWSAMGLIQEAFQNMLFLNGYKVKQLSGGNINGITNIFQPSFGGISSLYKVVMTQDPEKFAPYANSIGLFYKQVEE